MNAADRSVDQWKHRWGIVLAGGEGKRLKEFIRLNFGSDCPKQFSTIVGTRSMLRHTLDRAKKVISTHQLVTVITRPHLEYASQEVANMLPQNILVQPVAKETAPAILLPLLHIYRRDPQAAVAIFPSDHFVLEEDQFMEHVRAGFDHTFINPFNVVLLGIEPAQPEQEYGWIEPDSNATRQGNFTFSGIKRFYEKPDDLTAKSLFENGCLCNTMVLVSRAWILLKLFKVFLPEMYDTFGFMRRELHTTKAQAVLEHAYERIPDINFSKMILERSTNCLTVLRVRGVYWNDWGTEHRIREDIARLRSTRTSQARERVYATS